MDASWRGCFTNVWRRHGRIPRRNWFRIRLHGRGLDTRRERYQARRERQQDIRLRSGVTVRWR
jgi:hypothetical protein